MQISDLTHLHTTKHAGKVVLITGGSSGIGLATAKRVAREGAIVFITGRRQTELDKAKADIGHGVTTFQGDVAVAADLDRIFAAIKNMHGRLDILFANAGGGEFAVLGTITEAQVDKYFGINVKGTLFTVQKSLPLMGKGSAIVVTGSIAGNQGTPAFSVYAATKAALRSFVRTWASDLKDRDIRVNLIAPGVVVTPAYKSELGMSDQDIEQYLTDVVNRIPLGRVASADEMAKAMSFLASDDASYITGAELVVDGGMTQI
ncbi:SDR family oxidoreductase [Dyella humi]|uniref:SDR family oxidoreductase n=1 Tax=Dyella humi TaxID=1770547 RepID=A0ABW8IFA9_9GAMM